MWAPAIPCTRHALVEAFPATAWLPFAEFFVCSVTQSSHDPGHCSDQRLQDQKGQMAIKSNQNPRH